MLSALTLQFSMIMMGLFHTAHGMNREVCEHEAVDSLQSESYLMTTYGSSAPFDGCHWSKTKLDIKSLINSDFAAGAVMISFGAVLGKASPLQLMLMAVFEVIFHAANETIGVLYFGAVDMGGSIFVHTFGAYFGLSVSMVLTRHKKVHKDNAANKTSDMFAMIGTIFLWMYWPSFNGALAMQSQQHRVVINTLLSLSACCMTAFAASCLLRPKHKFCMVDIQNATLAGGVAVGSAADLVIEPHGAIIIGMVVRHPFSFHLFRVSTLPCEGGIESHVICSFRMLHSTGPTTGTSAACLEGWHTGGSKHGHVCCPPCMPVQYLSSGLFGCGCLMGSLRL